MTSERDRIAEFINAKAYESMPFSHLGGKASKFLKAPKKVTIFWMYFLLNDISLTEESNSSFKDVEELTVVADVVALDGDREIKLPGTHRVVILCRMLVG